jgi:hypothetical protein
MRKGLTTIANKYKKKRFLETAIENPVWKRLIEKNVIE